MEWKLYLIEALDLLKFLLIAGGCIVLLLLLAVADYWHEKKKDLKGLRKYAIAIVIAIALGAICIPSKQSMYLMVGLNLVEEVKNPEEITEETLEAVTKYLENAKNNLEPKAEDYR